jgi:hypothetical protein
VVNKTIEFLGQYYKFYEVDVASSSQLQYKHDATTYESFPDQYYILTCPAPINITSPLFLLPCAPSQNQKTEIASLTHAVPLEKATCDKTESVYDAHKEKKRGVFLASERKTDRK